MTKIYYLSNSMRVASVMNFKSIQRAISSPSSMVIFGFCYKILSKTYTLMQTKKFAAMICIGLLTSTSYAQDNVSADFGLNKSSDRVNTDMQTLFFEGVPLSVATGVSNEQRIKFDKGVKEFASLPEVASKLTFEIYGTNLLITASSPLESRVKVRLIDGSLIPIDLVVGTDLPSKPILITSVAPGSDEVVGATSARIPTHALHDNSAGAYGSGSQSAGFDALKLIRHAAQQYYAPKRLRVSDDQFKAVDVSGSAKRLYRTGVLKTKTLKSWMQGGYYVTSVLIENRSSATVHPDPRNLRGEFVAASFYDSTLSPAGLPGDDTLLFVVSSKPFTQAVSAWGR